MPTVNIIECSDPTELFAWHNHETQRQRCIVTLDLTDGRMTAQADPYTHESGLPWEIYYGFVRRYPIPLLTAEGANLLMAEIKPLAQRVLDDWHETTDHHHTTRAAFGEDADHAEQEICNACRTWEDEQKYLVAVHEVVTGLEADGYEITAETTDEQLEQYAAELTAEIARHEPSGVAVYHGLFDFYAMRRDECREEQ